MRYNKHLTASMALAASLVSLSQLEAQSVTALPPEFALPASAGGQPGFKVRVHQANKGSGDLANSIVRAESQLAGTLIDPATKAPYANDIDTVAFKFNADGTYDESLTIGYEQAGGGPNGSIPGIPGKDGNDNNIALEAVTWLSLKTGEYTMVVNSDDGFRVSAGLDARDRLKSIVLGEYDGGRGASDSVIKFSVSKDGLYSFRLLYYEGGGGANVSWLTAPTGDTTAQVLINDVAAGGVPAYRTVTAATTPYVSIASPGKDAVGVSPNLDVKLQIDDGSPTKVNTSSVKLSLDGTAVAASVTRSGSSTVVSYKGAALLDSNSKHKLKLEFADDGSPATTRSSEWEFTVATYTNVKLNTPLYFENFESTEEGGIPAGWTRQNYSDGGSGEFDVLNPNSDTYMDWVVISRETVQGASWDAARRLNVAESYVNGARVTSLVNGKFAYAESDNRGGNQVQYLFTKDYDLTGKKDIYIAYNSIYEQNQDSIGAVEYSIDQGKTWLPILYMIDGPDIVKDANGNVDAVATFNKENADTAAYTDPTTGETKGDNYGAFIGAPITQDLAPYIQARVNDDSVESKRVEFFRLPKADGQANVRLRFAQAGTGSWYFGIDDLGIYSISSVDAPKIATQPAAVSVLAGLGASLKVVATGVGVTYQWKLNGTDIAGATSDTYSIAKVASANGGTYTVAVSNAGGSVTSDPVTLTVRPAPTTVATGDGLVAYFKFDGDYKDSSSSAIAATAVGSPTFETGYLGKGVHISTKKDGSANNIVTLGYPNALKFGDSKDFSVSFWVKINSQADDHPFISNKDWNSSNNEGWGIFSQSGGNYRVNITGPNKSADKFSKTSGAIVGGGNWHNLVVTVKRTGNVNTYVDGVLIDTTAIVTKGTIDTDALANPLVFNIGQDGTGGYTDGGASEIDMLMDDVAIWTRVLADDEVGGIYLGGAAGKDLTALAGTVAEPQTSPGLAENNGATPAGPTVYVNPPASTQNNGKVESLGVAVLADGNIAVGWEDDGDALADQEAVWTLYSPAGKSLIASTTMTSIDPDYAGQTFSSSFLSYFRKDGSAVSGRTSWGPKVKANLFGNGFGMGATAFDLGKEVAEMTAVQNTAAGENAGDFPGIQLLNNNGTPIAVVSGVSDAYAERDGDIRIGDWDYLANGNIVVVGESRQRTDLVDIYGGTEAKTHGILSVIKADGTVVKAEQLLGKDPTEVQIWHGSAVTANGFAVRYAATTGAKLQRFDNNGNKVGEELDLATVTGSPISAGGGRGEGIGFHGNGKDAYVLATAGTDADGKPQIWVAVLNADGTKRWARTLSDSTSLPHVAIGRVDAAIDASGRVVVVYADTGATASVGGSTSLILGRLFDAQGNALGQVFSVSENEVPAADVPNSIDPRVDWRGSTVSVAWESLSQKTDNADAKSVVALRTFTVAGGTDVGPTASGNVPAGLGGQALSNVVVDSAKKTITADLPANGNQGYLTINPPVIITSVKVEGGKLVVTYQ